MLGLSGKRKASLLVFVAFVGISFSVPASSIDSKCSACQAIAFELQQRLDKEVPKNHLDMRHRLDGDGNRYGKMIPYKESELRVHDLLDTLCKEMEKYSLIVTNTTEGSEARLWMKVTGEGSSAVSANMRPGKAEEKEQRRRLESHCALTLDDLEEDLSSAIREGETDSTPAEELLCKVLTPACKIKKKKVIPPRTEL
jgi:hypothetical protein